MWTGLLNWSLKQQDPTTDISQIQPMSEEDKQWVREMMKEYEIDIAEEMRAALAAILSFKPEEEDYEDKVLSQFENLMDLVQGIDSNKSKDFATSLPYV